MGFIITGADKEIFFHERQILGGAGDEAHEGQTAWFHVRRSRKGLEALNVELSDE
jgi:cold shock CspA family protein